MDEVREHLTTAFHTHIATDVRAFVFRGQQLHIPAVSETAVGLSIYSPDGKPVLSDIARADASDKSNLVTGVLVKPLEEHGESGSTADDDDFGDGEFDFT